MPETEIAIDEAPEGERKLWFNTRRPFEADLSLVDPKMLERYASQYGPWDTIKYQLGFQEAEVEDWVKSQSPILEVGPGEGVSSEQLLQLGVNLSIIEPSLRYPFNPDFSPAEARLKGRFTRPEFEGRVKAVVAADAARAFPNQRFRAAFAIGPNFQTYSPSFRALLNQFAGVLSALEDTSDNYFAFEFDDIAVVGPKGYLQGGEKYNLRQFFDDNNLRYTPTHPWINCDNKGTHTIQTNGIRLYRRSADGTDAVKQFAAAVYSTDLSRYRIKPSSYK